MQSRNKKTIITTRKTKNKKRSFLKRRFLKIPIWIWLVLLVIGLANSSGDNTTTSPNVTPTSTVETLASIAPEATVEPTPSIEPTNIPTNEPTEKPSTIEPTATQTITAAPTNDPTQYVLKQGDKNDDVRQLQKRLIALGYLAGSADGDFGPKTEKAVIAYQKAAGIMATGECDYNTYRSLTSNDAPVAPKPIATEKPATDSNDSGTTYIGNKNSDIFHYAWCESVNKMKESNKVPFSSRDAATSKGYRPCKNCNP